VKSALKGTHFQPVSEVKLKIAGLLNRVPADDKQHCFEQRNIHMQRCINRGESIMKGIDITFKDSENKPYFSHQQHLVLQIHQTKNTCIQ
jgi:hypothetical protein